MTLDTTARKLAYNLTDRFGKSVIMRRQTMSTYDPEDGSGGNEQVPVDYPVKVTPPKDFMFAKIDGTLIQKGDQVVSLPALNLKVDPDENKDVFVIDDDKWKIKQIGRLWSGELVAMYIIHLTK